MARGCSAVGSASPCQGEGRGFESRRPLEGSHINPAVEWPSGDATACKAVHTGSIPVSTSIFDPPARLAQRESASLTRKRSLVQSQYRAPHKEQLRPGFRTGPFLLFEERRDALTQLCRARRSGLGIRKWLPGGAFRQPPAPSPSWPPQAAVQVRAEAAAAEVREARAAAGAAQERAAAGPRPRQGRQSGCPVVRLRAAWRERAR